MEQAKAGSYVVCIKSEIADTGAGWENDKIFKTKEEGMWSLDEIAWPDGGGNGIYWHSLRPATEAEIQWLGDRKSAKLPKTIPEVVGNYGLY